MAQRIPDPVPGQPCLGRRVEHAHIALHPPLADTLRFEPGPDTLVVALGGGSALLTPGAGPPRRVRLRDGGALLLDGNDRHVLSRDAVELVAVAFDPGRLAGLAGDPAYAVPPAVERIDAGLAALGHELRRALIADSLPDAAYLAALATALGLRAARAGGTGAGVRESLSPPVLARVLAHIEAALSGPVAVADLARLAGLSRAHFTRAFARATGDPPQRFLLKRRVCRARDLLAAREGALAEIALRTGFASQAHLTHAFRREVGTTPARYRAAFDPTLSQHDTPPPGRRDGAPTPDA